MNCAFAGLQILREALSGSGPSLNASLVLPKTVALWLNIIPFHFADYTVKSGGKNRRRQLVPLGVKGLALRR